MNKPLTWYKIADQLSEISFATNNMAVIKVNGKTLCLGLHQGACFAFAYKCPHAGGIMADGFIDALGNVVCPLHRYKFSMLNGRNVSGEGYYLKHWPVEQRDDGLYVGMEKWSLF